MPKNAGQFKRKLFVTAGQRIGRGIVIDPDAGMRNGRRTARLRCDCGQEYEAQLSNLLQPRGTTSCGCQRRDNARNNARAMGAQDLTRGFWSHPLYGTWNGMMRRCYNPEQESFPRYGGRGIKVCDRWHDLVLFVADIERLLGPRPEGMTLDRWPDGDGDYVEGNVRWATREEQTRHRQATKLTEEAAADCRERYLWGEPVPALAAEYGVSVRTMYDLLAGETWATAPTGMAG